MTSFALIGAPRYLAPRQIEVFSAVGGDIRLAFDPKDSLGIIRRLTPSRRRRLPRMALEIAEARLGR